MAIKKTLYHCKSFLLIFSCQTLTAQTASLRYQRLLLLLSAPSELLGTALVKNER